MHIKLIPATAPLHDTCAAFLRGASPAQWLQTIDQLNVDPSKLECYAIPQSIQSVTPAGLFIIFKPGDVKHPELLLAPYGKVGNKLFVPVNAALYPAVTGEELQSVLLYERNILHPSIGLVGFDSSDSVALESLITYNKPVGLTWNAAHPGNMPAPRLTQIVRKIATGDDLLQALRDGQDTKPLKDIPKPKNTSSWTSRVPLGLTGILASGIGSVLNALSKSPGGLSGGMSSGTFSGSSSGASGGSFSGTSGMGTRKPGMLDKLRAWLAEQKTSLEERRHNEIERLLNMFDKNPDEALRYAPPLDSNTPHRGTVDKPSSNLSRGATDFNLGSLNGGGPADHWSVNQTQHQRLRTHYRETAKKEIEKKNFKKAAYIYAHLLNDFAEAARALELGEHYHEAAMLYRDHLNNQAKAAACFEKGGFLPEAIALYNELKLNEKAGDLYRQLEQHDNAQHSYTLAQQKMLNNDDYIEAARITEEKLEAPDQALALLAKGWNTSRQAEQCLQRYVQTTLQKEPNTAADRINTLYTQQTPQAKASAFLRVLQQNQSGKNPDSFTLASRNIAYRIISNLAQTGDISALRSLKTFLPDDQLVTPDYKRYTTLQSKQRNISTAGIRLDRSIKWINAINHNDQFIVLGIKDKGLHLARINWNGNIAYTTWNVTVHPTDRFNFIADAANTNQIVLLPSRSMPLEQKVLEQNALFDKALVITTPPALPDGCLGMTFTPNGTIAAVENDNYRVNLLHYKNDFSTHTSTLCTPEQGIPFVMTRAGSLSEVFFYNDLYITYTGSTLFRIATSGMLQAYELNELIWMSDMSPATDQLLIVLAHEKGFFVYSHAPGNGPFLEAHEFTEAIMPAEVRFISADKFMICGKQKMLTYRIIGTDVEKIEEKDTHATVRSVFKGRYRNQYALLYENGTIEIKALA